MTGNTDRCTWSCRDCRCALPQSPESRDPLQRLRRLGSCPLPAAEDGANTQEKIARLYQEHLAKMMGHRPELSPAYSMDHYQR